MVLIPIVALVIGALLAIFVSGRVDPTWAPYMAVAALAALDSVFGGARSAMENTFSPRIFITGILINLPFALFLAWMGEQIAINLFLVNALIFGMRIFNNLSLIRRMLISRWEDARERRRRQEA